ncbi:hypothetical protein BST61_g5336 [Cercospora zeina]
MAVASLIFLKTLYFWAPQDNIEFRLNRLSILVVDYDGGRLGQQLNATYRKHAGPQFPTFFFNTVDDYETEEDIFQAVTRQSYWGAVYTQHNASSRLESMLQGSTLAENDAHQSASLVYVWNEAVYPMVSGWVKDALRRTTEDTQSAFMLHDAFTSLPADQQYRASELRTRLEAIFNMLQPLERTACSGMALGQAAFNHLAMIALATGGDAFVQIYRKKIQRGSKLARGPKFRRCFMAGWNFSCFLGLALTASPWIVKGIAGSHLTYREFLLSWLVLWPGAFASLAISCALRTWIKEPLLIKSCTLFWMAINAASAFVPIEVSPSIFVWNWIFPGHAVYILLVTTWCHAGNPQAASALPVLFFWTALGMTFTWYGMTDSNKDRIEEKDHD